MIKLILITFVSSLFAFGSVSSGAAVVHYTLTGDIDSSVPFSGDTFSIRIGYDDVGDIQHFSLRLDGAGSPVWIASNSNADMNLYDDVSSPSPPVLVLEGPLTYNSSDVLIYGDVFSVIGSASMSQLPSGFDALGFSLTDSWGRPVNGGLVPMDLSFDMFNGGLVPVGSVDYQNALYVINTASEGTTPSEEYWNKIGTITASCSGFHRECPVPVVVPIPAPIWLMLSGLVGLLFVKLSYKSK